MLKLLFEIGVRNEEARKIKKSNLKFDKNIIRINGKGRR